jgi:pimeloyl-ACP methyl ester carboxylesterase
MPDIADTVTAYYVPPGVFVRDSHRGVADFAPASPSYDPRAEPRLFADSNWPAAYFKKEREVEFMVRQEAERGGSSRRTILLRRPPVFLVHGLASDRESWNQFQPLVPAEGLGADAFKPIEGFDGRFDVFASERTPFARSLASEAEELRRYIGKALDKYLPGYSIGKVDVIGHSMGALLVRKLDNQIAANGGKSPFRKLIAIDSPFKGSALANVIAENRDKLPVKTELEMKFKDPAVPNQEVAISVDPLDPTALIDTAIESIKRYEQLPEGLLDQAKLKIKPQLCQIAIQSSGLSPQFSAFQGALDDLKEGSEEILALDQSGIRIPSHHVTGGARDTDLGVDTLVEGLWTLLGLGEFCNLTPDTSTIEKTQSIKTGIEAVKTAIPIFKAFKARKGAERTKALLDVWDKYDRTVRKVIVEQTQSTSPSSQTALDQLEKALVGDRPQPVFKSEGSDAVVSNDRIVPELSQAGGIPFDSQAVTSVDLTDHLVVRDTSLIIPEACLIQSLKPPLIDSALRDFNLINYGSGFGAEFTTDITCSVLRLLEADPTSNRFFRTP